MPGKKFKYSGTVKVILPDGTVKPWGRSEFEMERVDGKWVSHLISSEKFLPPEEQAEYEAAMMKRTGEQMSLYYSSRKR